MDPGKGPPSPIPSRSSSGARKPRLRWLWLAVLVAISCGASDSELNLQAGSPTDRGRIFLIELDDGGVDGRRLVCGDSAVPVEVTFPRRSRALEGSLRALLAMRETFDTRTSFYNALHGSNLEIERIDRNGPEVRVHLRGYLEIGGDCDGRRALAQLTETAIQFPDVERAVFYLEGKALAGLLRQ